MMITMEIFNYFLIAMSFLALLVFVALYFVKAGYGIFRTSSWGISIPNKTAWVLMEAPVFSSVLLVDYQVKIHFPSLSHFFPTL